MIKISKWEGVVILLAAVFLAFTAGWFLRGSSSARPLRVETERSLEAAAAVTALPAPAGQRPAEPEKININTADAETLAALPGIGEKRAAAIIADREENGPFRFSEEITRVKGIGEETMNQFIGRITVEDDT